MEWSWGKIGRNKKDSEGWWTGNMLHRTRSGGGGLKLVKLDVGHPSQNLAILSSGWNHWWGPSKFERDLVIELGSMRHFSNSVSDAKCWFCIVNVIHIMYSLITTSWEHKVHSGICLNKMVNGDGSHRYRVCPNSAYYKVRPFDVMGKIHVIWNGDFVFQEMIANSDCAILFYCGELYCSIMNHVLPCWYKQIGYCGGNTTSPVAADFLWMSCGRYYVITQFCNWFTTTVWKYLCMRRPLMRPYMPTWFHFNPNMDK